MTLRGLARMLPRLREYFGKMPRPQVDGGYYTKTRDNMPLVGPLGAEGSFVAGAVSGYGIMSACAVGELAAAHVLNTPLPTYAEALSPARFENEDYLKQLEAIKDDGQL